MTLQYEERCIRENGSLFCRDLKIIGEKIIENWWRNEGHRVDLEDVTDVLAENPEIFVVGMGYAGFMEISNPLRSTLKDHGIQLVAEKTPEAVKSFNELHSQRKKVAAAFHLTC
jgi:hypothetical protein